MSEKSSIVSSLLSEKAFLETVINEAKLRMKTYPEGAVIIRKHRKQHQFFIRTDPKDTEGTYIPISERDKAYALVRKKYDQKIFKAAEKQLKAINRFLNQYDPESLMKVYSGLSPVRKNMVNPVELPDREYIQQWEATEYRHKGFPEDLPEHYTDKGERVRSKSEVMIANALKNSDIPYHYEYPLTLEGIEIYPDFTILRKRDRKVVIWDHFGLMDDAYYRQEAFSKIRLYERNGYHLGESLLVTFETYKQPLNTSYINSIMYHLC